ncbi:MAG: hypothetical protein JW965_02800 [Bacteroidales bacterium]|nr:hypothetical protein [Bacteroidales bacterium]
MMTVLRNSSKILLIILISFLGMQCNTGINNSTGLIPDADNGGISLPQGFSALVVADDLGRGRHIDVNDNGDIYMALRRLNNGKGVVALCDTSGDGRADIIKYFGDHAGTGMEIHNGYLYFGGDTMVLRYKLEPGMLAPEQEPELVVSGFPDQNQHRDKPFAIDNAGYIYVNVGAPSNACMEQTRTIGSPGMYPCPQLERQAGIWRFRVDKLNQTQQENGYRYASGIRNSIALTWNHLNDNLYVVMHGRDQLHQFYPDLYTERESAELPAEELLLVKDGSVFSWPYYYYDQIKKKMVLAPEYGGDGEKTEGPVEVEDPIMGFAGTEVVKSPSRAEHRPMGIAMGGDGSIYVCDSQKGKIWRIFYEGE